MRRGPHTCGREAAIALGADIDDVAARNRRSGARLREHLQHDRSLCVDKSKRLYYLDPPAPPRRPSAEARVAAAPYPLSNTFRLHSKPGAAKTIFLDFDGQILTGTAWNASTGEPVLAVPPFNTPSTDDPATFSAAERKSKRHHHREPDGNLAARPAVGARPNGSASCQTRGGPAARVTSRSSDQPPSAAAY